MKKVAKRIIFDTNFLVDIVKFKIDLGDIDKLITRPYRFETIGSVVSELKKINNKNSKVALKIIYEKKFKILKARHKNVDDEIVDIVKKNERDKKPVVATNDTKLRKRIKALDAKVIYLRAKKHLEVH